MADIKLTRNAIKVLKARYLKRDASGELIETPEEMFKRVANNIASANEKYGEDPERDKEAFFNLMASLDFLPNSPTLMNADNDLQQLSACFVLPIEDSMDGIFDALKYTALIQKSGGGTGFSFSRLRPKSDIVKTTGGVASGPISFMEIFDAATNTVKQGGKRRGANMGILRVDHPDIMEFITAKADENRLNNFNISVAVTDEFMEAVKKDEEYDLVNPRSGQVVGQLRAREVFNKIVEMAHKNGEPGIIFIDEINRHNPTPHLGEIESTNPCGEQPLLPYEACNLGSINLSHMVKNEGDKPEVDFEKLENTVRTATRFLDNVIDMNRYPLEQIKEMVYSNRKIGLGVMGWSDLLIRLGIPYNSDRAVNLAEKVMKFINEISHDESHKIARKRGSFPNIEGSIYDKSMRNATTTTIAPTGSISIIAGCSSGIEPLFAINYERHVLDDTLIEVHPYFEKIARERGFYSEELMAKVAERGSIQGMSEIPEDVQKIFVTAHDIEPEWHIKMQAAFQKWVDNAVSKTVNFRHEATKEDVARVYTLAYDLKCKGVTIYRDGSRSEQVLATGRSKTYGNNGFKKRPRPKITYGTTEKTKIGCGKLYITINADDKGICEVFTTTGKGGGCHAQSEAISRLASLAIRSGISIKEITDQLKGIRCEAALIRKGVNNTSCPDAIGRAIEKFVRATDNGRLFQQNLSLATDENNSASNNSSKPGKSSKNNKTGGISLSKEDDGSSKTTTGSTCPECGYKLEHEGGCTVCRNCGFSKCG
ncbi:ribonucleoside-diphosphate reductase, adenosylcobalamin-dependent [Halothermothrix orenii H 168]|uniref:Vitamin B12-dependent ribonucleotide reductase n=1 Tax=Halothermothrix orenii (strain H 168 / OCM 544 / DSM 9562) TaxID=373903 RepID=B8D0M9_HALOH|nr:vitamin B12-dependent ribonucleotide reductase [Halothermothrix orenii]ACL70965.1 ribonucleoside-diphosphate reductase, adenosylcobalamin-dependent [Halothermothrix orenii H 168]